MRLKTMQKTVITLCLAALAGLAAPAPVHGEEPIQITDPDFQVDGEGRMTAYTGSEMHVVIPDGVKILGGDPNKSIFEDAQEPVQSVVIPDSVTEISEGAFVDCRDLQEVTMGNGVTRIGAFAFFGCSNLKTISLPEGLEEIAPKAFCFCQNLETLELPSSLRTIEFEAFGNCSLLRTIRIPDGVRTIPQDTFFQCYSLEELYIPSSVTRIGTGSTMRPESDEDSAGLEDSKNLTIYGAAGSAAQEYAEENQIPFVEDASLQSTLAPEPEEEEPEKETKPGKEEEQKEEKEENAEEEEGNQEKEEEPSVSRTMILGLTVGAAVLMVILIAVMIRIAGNSRRR